MSTYDDLHKSLGKMSEEEKEAALSLLAKIGIDLTKRKGELTGSQVCGFIFQNKTHGADSHKDVFLKLTDFLLRNYPDKREVVFSIKGTKKKYFSTNPSDFKHGYEKIRGTNIYVDTNENAAQLNRRCQRLLQAFGFDPDELLILQR
jgi:hypothetical protein